MVHKSFMKAASKPLYISVRRPDYYNPFAVRSIANLLIKSDDLFRRFGHIVGSLNYSLGQRCVIDDAVLAVQVDRMTFVF